MARRERPPATTTVVRPEVPVLTFLGGAGTVTGSRFLIDTPRARVLVDAGLMQGPRQARQMNWEPFPVPPHSLDAIVLTHAHVDHSGYLPVLVRDGFDGPIHTTQRTADLVSIVLPDSGHLHEEEADYRNRKGFSKHRPALPLYTEADAWASLDNLEPTPYDVETEIAPGVFLTLRTAGHILGSATATLRLSDSPDSPDGSGRVVVFSGDLGRPHHPLLRPPTPIGRADVVVMESTYGNRHHDDELAIERFADAVNRTVRRGGTLLIPAFAVDRTEVILHRLRALIDSGAIPSLPVYVDSPMALRALRVYREAIDEGDPDLRPELRGPGDLFDTGDLHEVMDVEGSKALADLTAPAIIVSASGMASGGRVVHHLARLLPDRRNTVLLVGFQAPGTRGCQLADGERELKMLGRYVRVRAEIVDIGAFSVHADQSELVDWLDTAEPPPEIVYLVHGEPDAAAALRDLINERDPWDAVVARLGERVRLD